MANLISWMIYRHRHLVVNIRPSYVNLSASINNYQCTWKCNEACHFSDASITTFTVRCMNEGLFMLLQDKDKGFRANRSKYDNRKGAPKVHISPSAASLLPGSPSLLAWMERSLSHWISCGNTYIHQCQTIQSAHLPPSQKCVPSQSFCTFHRHFTWSDYNTWIMSSQNSYILDPSYPNS